MSNAQRRRQRNERSMIIALFRLLIFPVYYRPYHHDSASGRLVSRASGMPIIRRARGRFAEYEPASPASIAPIPFVVIPAKLSRETMRLQAHARKLALLLARPDKVDKRRLSTPQGKRYALRTRVSNRPDRQAPRQAKIDHLVDRLDDLRVVGWSEVIDYSLHGSGINTHYRQRVKPAMPLDSIEVVRLTPQGQTGKLTGKASGKHRIEAIARMLR
jgi:hypothetical protein